MNTTRLAPLFAALTALALPAFAADAPASAAPAPAKAPAPQTFRDVPDVKVEQLVNEDDKVRIEETRVRGLTQKVVVKNKDSKAPEYEILLGDTGRDLPTRQGADRGNAGSRVWRIFNF
ncbi:hypothetical protein [Mitsuaria sp. GD03876]|uniref:hypothetical protein n=1 Tax=Mitsuaria sp. GD03876 TaxID=2975399 RepID=UPI00244730AC|nr:hypothetical protein [Mitsuaria sp. GD03876]MDH0865263.1 hypothetical protein [Mitsuaria sp. GD03876]